MANQPQDLKNFVFKYGIDKFEIIIPGEKEPIVVDPKGVGGMVIECDYEGSHFPLFRVDVTLDRVVYYKILDYKTEVRFKMRVNKYRLFQDKMDKKSRDFDETFISFLPEEDSLTRDMVQAARNNSDRSANETGTQKMSLYLFKEDDLIKTKKIISTVITSDSMPNITTYLLASAGFKKVLMTPMDNHSSYKEIVLPPYTMLNTISYLETRFGFYKTGAMIFFDIGTTYILKNSLTATAWRKNEYKKVIVHVAKPFNNETAMSGNKINDKDKTFVLDVEPRAVRISKPSILRDQLTGNHRLVVNPLNDATYNLKSKVEQRGDGTYNVLMNPYDNKYANSAEKFMIESSSVILRLTVNDIDRELCQPNKEFLFVFQDKKAQKKYGGNYRLIKADMVYSGAGSNMDSIALLTFKK